MKLKEFLIRLAPLDENLEVEFDTGHYDLKLNSIKIFNKIIVINFK